MGAKVPRLRKFGTVDGDVAVWDYTDEKVQIGDADSGGWETTPGEIAWEAILHERERCAKIAEKFGGINIEDEEGTIFSVGEEIAARIRAGD